MNSPEVLRRQFWGDQIFRKNLILLLRNPIYGEIGDRFSQEFSCGAKSIFAPMSLMYVHDW